MVIGDPVINLNFGCSLKMLSSLKFEHYFQYLDISRHFMFPKEDSAFIMSSKAFQLIKI
jgi:hypothetical protein